jgi:hypothetical protein
MDLIKSFLFGFRATVFCLVAPARFLDLAREHDRKISTIESGVEHSASIVRQAFWSSCLLTGGSLLVGYFLGGGLRCAAGPASAHTATLVQAFSAALVLVATLAAQGWNIQTYNGNTLVERVNQWLTRSLFVLGTFLFSLFLGWVP